MELDLCTKNKGHSVTGRWWSWISAPRTNDVQWLVGDGAGSLHQERTFTDWSLMELDLCTKNKGNSMTGRLWSWIFAPRTKVVQWLVANGAGSLHQEQRTFIDWPLIELDLCTKNKGHVVTGCWWSLISAPRTKDIHWLAADGAGSLHQE